MHMLFEIPVCKFVIQTPRSPTSHSFVVNLSSSNKHDVLKSNPYSLGTLVYEGSS